MTTHEAGRELDALIAEKVMGYRQEASYWWRHPNGPRTSIDGLPRFSTDIAAAWTIIDHHPHYVSLVRSVDVTRFGFAPHATWKCRFYAPQSFEAEADTAALAICRAALLAEEHTL